MLYIDQHEIKLNVSKIENTKFSKKHKNNAVTIPLKICNREVKAPPVMKYLTIILDARFIMSYFDISCLKKKAHILRVGKLPQHWMLAIYRCLEY